MKAHFLEIKPKQGTALQAMAAWIELPDPLLKNIVKYLSLRDKINVSFTCKSWFIDGREHFEKVELDGSSTYGGSWIENNKRLLETTSLDKTDSTLAMETSTLISNLVECTDSIKSLSIDCTFITTDDICKLIHSQRALEELTIWNRPELGVKSPEVSIFEEIVKGIVQNQKSLKCIDIGLRLRESPAPLPYLLDVFGFGGNKHITFPNLRVMHFYPIGVLGNNASLLVEKMYQNSNMEVIGMETHWLNPSMGSYLREGKLSKAKKLNRDYSAEEIKIMISKCPDISQIGSSFKVPNEELMKELLQKFGHKIEVLDCFIGTNELGVVFENCPHLKSIKLQLSREMSLDEKRLYYPRLKQLRGITLFEKLEIERESCTTIEIIRNCAESIQDLSLMTSKRISNCDNTIGLFESLADCQKLHSLSLDLAYTSGLNVKRFGLVIKNKYHRPIHAQLLQSFEFYMGNEDENKFDLITTDIICYGQELASMEFSDLKSFPRKNMMCLIQELPECKLTVY